jgi:hypothetical protein
MTQDARRPLHRLTPLRDDPAAPGCRSRSASGRDDGWFGWLAFVTSWLVMWWALVFLVRHLARRLRVRPSPHGRRRAGLAGDAHVMRRKSAKLAQLVRDERAALAVAVDDFSELDGSRTARVVSVVGWIRARGSCPSGSAASRASAGARLPPEVPGRARNAERLRPGRRGGTRRLVQVAGGAMLGASNVNLTDAHARRLLIASLNLPWARSRPAGMPSCCGTATRDGVGFKQTALDPTQRACARRRPARRWLVAAETAADLSDRGRAAPQWRRCSTFREQSPCRTGTSQS